MGKFDRNNGDDRREDAPWRRANADAVTLEGEIVGDSIHVAPPEPESFWGANATRLGKRLLIVAAVLVALIILVPLTLAFIAVVAITAIVGRLLLGRTGAVSRWMRPPGRQT